MDWLIRWTSKHFTCVFATLKSCKRISSMFLWLFFLAVVLWYWRRLRYFARWDHIPGYKSTWRSVTTIPLHSNCCTNIMSQVSFPLIGHLYIHAKAPIEKLLESRQKFGEVFRLDSGFIPTVWLCNYDDITMALKQDSLQYRSVHIDWVKELENLYVSFTLPE